MRAEPVTIDWTDRLSIFASERYLRSVSHEHGWLAGVDTTGRQRCILPYSVVSKAGCRLVRFPVETMPISGCASIDAESERRFLCSATEYFRSIDADVVIPATFSALFKAYPDGAVCAPYGNIIVDLTQSEDALWKRVHSKHRNVIRNAQKKGVTIRTGIEYLDEAYALTAASFQRSAVGIFERRRIAHRLSREAFREQVLSFGEYVRVFVAELGGTVQSAAVIPFSQHSAYYMHGGSIDAPLTGSSNLLQWEAMRALREVGVQEYNFFGARVLPDAGSKAEGIRKFKERFGGESREGYMWKYPIHPLKYRLYNVAAWIRNGGDVVDQERRRHARVQ